MVTVMRNRRRPAIFKAAIYIRLSQEDGDKAESNSVTNQRKLLQLKSLEAKLNNGKPIEIEKRPEVKKFLENKNIESLSREVWGNGRNAVISGISRILHKILPLITRPT